MALVLKKVFLSYFWIFDELSDPKVIEQDLFLMSSPIKPLLVIVAYFYFIYNLGPRLMQHRKPFDLKKVMQVYNIMQILANVYVVYESIYEIWYHMNWSCQPIDYSTNPHTIHILKMYHFFFITKLLDMLDTIFFVLRKRQRQVTFLHVYHHFGMFVMLWVCVKFVAGGYGTWVGVINGSVHVIMYTYYFLTSFDEKWKQNVEFKRFITLVQMTQFTLLILIYGRQLFIDCGYPKVLSFFFVPQNFFMLILFGDFYRKVYLKKPVK